MSEIAKHFRCRHIFTDGHRCGSKCLRQEDFCYYHHNTRRPAPERHGPALAEQEARKASFDLPILEDRSAIQAAIAEIARRISGNQLNSRRAGLLLYAMQIASTNLPRLPAVAPALARDMVDEITVHPTFGELAPEAEFHLPQREKTLEQILMEQWEKEP